MSKNQPFEWRHASDPPKSEEAGPCIVWACDEHHIAWYEWMDSGGMGWIRQDGHEIKDVKWWTYAPEPPGVER